MQNTETPGMKDTVASETCSGLKSGGLAKSLFKKLDYKKKKKKLDCEAPSSSCLVRQLLLYLPGLFCEKLSLKISRLGYQLKITAEETVGYHTENRDQRDTYMLNDETCPALLLYFTPRMLTARLIFSRRDS